MVAINTRRRGRRNSCDILIQLLVDGWARFSKRKNVGCPNANFLEGKSQVEIWVYHLLIKGFIHCNDTGILPDCFTVQVVGFLQKSAQTHRFQETISLFHRFAFG
jgi:hypothetical protein